MRDRIIFLETIHTIMMHQTKFLIVCLILLCACSNAKKESTTAKGELTSDASLLQIEKNDQYTKVSILDPWNKGKILHDYILVPKDQDIPSGLPKGTVVRTPVTRALVYSSVHATVIKELGKISAISGVCDAEYFKIPEISQGLKTGAIGNAGSSMAPTIEKIIDINPEIIILSPFQNGGYGTLTTLEIPILECADYMEDSPIGRAEWIKLFGLLFGEEEKANTIFENTKKEYETAKQAVSKATNKPKVITETVSSGVWFVPGGDSYMARIITDSGAIYPWADNKETGSLQLDFAQVLDKAHDADFWLIKSSTIKTYSDLKKAYDLNDRFDAFKNKKVWVCDTQEAPLYEEFPFHPELLLKEYAAIFHPDIIGSDYKYRYYKPLSE